MKVLVLNGSPNKNGCIGTALEEVITTLEKDGLETETIHIGNKDIRGCISCNKCMELGKCVFNDLVNEVAPKFLLESSSRFHSRGCKEGFRGPSDNEKSWPQYGISNQGHKRR